MSTKKRNPETEAYKIRSICFDDDLLDAIESQRADLRMSRSELVRAILEEHFDILPHPELHAKLKTTKPLTRGVRGPSKTVSEKR